jgi:tetratricopeptide (TPR) repeat protein
MGELWIQARPRNRNGLAALEEAVNRKAVADMLEMQRYLVGLYPEDAPIHAALAAAYDANGEVDSSMEHYRRAVELDPDFEQAHYNLALLLEPRGDVRGAERHYREAIRAFPEFADAHNNLGSLLSRSNRIGEAEGHFRRALEVDPRHAGAHVNLGSLARARGQIDVAVSHYRRALEAARGTSDLPFRPADLRFNLALLLIIVGEPDEALDHLAEGARLDPGNFAPRIAAGWMLATHPDASVRRPEDALRLGEAIRTAMGDDPQVLDLLAAGHAAAGRFDQATALGEDAQRRARAAGERELVDEIGQRLALYRQNRPFIARRP